MERHCGEPKIFNRLAVSLEAVAKKETQTLLNECTYWTHNYWAQTWCQDYVRPRDTVAIPLWWEPRNKGTECLDCKYKEGKWRWGDGEAGRLPFLRRFALWEMAYRLLSDETRRRSSQCGKWPGMSLVGKGRGHVENPKPREQVPGSWREGSWEGWRGGQGSGATRLVQWKCLEGLISGMMCLNFVLHDHSGCCGVKQLNGWVPSPRCLKMQTPCIPPNYSVNAPQHPAWAGAKSFIGMPPCF